MNHHHQLNDCACWPIIRKILVKDGKNVSKNIDIDNAGEADDFRFQIDPNIDQIFICDNGHKALVIRKETIKITSSDSNPETRCIEKDGENFEDKFRIFFWNDNQCKTDGNGGWTLIEEVFCPIKSLLYDHGWLFLLTNNDHLYCRNLYEQQPRKQHRKEAPQETALSEQDKEQEIHSKYQNNKTGHGDGQLYPFEQCLSMIDDNRYNRKHCPRMRMRMDREDRSSSFIMDGVGKIKHSPRFTAVLSKDKTLINLFEWTMCTQPQRRLVKHRVESTYPQFPRLRFQDVATFEQAWATLTNQQTLIVEGCFWNETTMTNGSFFYHPKTIIDLNCMNFSLNTSDVVAAESLLFTKLYATRHQILLLTNGGQLCCLLFQRTGYQMIPGSFRNEHNPILDVYSHYSTPNFVAIGHQGQLFVYCPILNPDGSVMILDYPGSRNSLIPIRFESIPDAYSIYVQPGDMPQMSSFKAISYHHFFRSKSISTDQQNHSQHFQFNDPLTADRLISFNGHRYYLHTKLIENVEKYFDRQIIMNPNDDDHEKQKMVVVNVDGVNDQVDYVEDDQNSQETYADDNQSSPNVTTLAMVADHLIRVDPSNPFESFNPELIRAFLRYFYTQKFELSAALVLDELGSFLYMLEQLTLLPMFQQCLNKKRRQFWKQMNRLKHYPQGTFVVVVKPPTQQQQQQPLTQQHSHKQPPPISKTMITDPSSNNNNNNNHHHHGGGNRKTSILNNNSNKLRMVADENGNDLERVKLRLKNTTNNLQHSNDGDTFQPQQASNSKPFK